LVAWHSSHEMQPVGTLSHGASSFSRPRLLDWLRCLIFGFGPKPLAAHDMSGHRPSQQLQAGVATSLICLQLFAQSGLEMAAFADMEALSNDMGLFLQVH